MIDNWERLKSFIERWKSVYLYSIGARFTLNLYSKYVMLLTSIQNKGKILVCFYSKITSDNSSWFLLLSIFSNFKLFMSFFHYFLIIVIKCTFCYKIYFLLVTYSKLYSNPLFLPNIRKKLQNSTCNEKNVYYVYLIKLYWFYIYAAFSNTCVALGFFFCCICSIHSFFLQ